MKASKPTPSPQSTSRKTTTTHLSNKRKSVKSASPAVMAARLARRSARRGWLISPDRILPNAMLLCTLCLLCGRPWPSIKAKKKPGRPKAQMDVITGKSAGVSTYTAKVIRTGQPFAFTGSGEAFPIPSLINSFNPTGQPSAPSANSGPTSRNSEELLFIGGGLLLLLLLL